MRGVRIRYRDGSTDEWSVKDAMPMEKLADYFRLGFASGRKIAFAAESEDGRPSDLNVVGVNLADVVSWQVSGLSNLEQETVLWAELDGLGGVDEEK